MGITAGVAGAWITPKRFSERWVRPIAAGSTLGPGLNPGLDKAEQIPYNRGRSAVGLRMPPMIRRARPAKESDAREGVPGATVVGHAIGAGARDSRQQGGL